MVCKICGGNVKKIFTKKVLYKYDVDYYKCQNCNFIQTDEPFWLEEAYKNAINYEDIGTSFRSVMASEDLTALFHFFKFDSNKKYLDYGAGYGLFVRMMRDNGYNFFWYDEYCENIFAAKFDVDIRSENEEKFEVVTAFEVFEHLSDPIKELEKMLMLSDNILFSTELVNRSKTELENWWYISSHHGQHIAFYDIKTLEYIANKYDLNLYSHKNLHFLTKRKLSKFFYKYLSLYRISRVYNTLFTPKSLLGSDYKLLLEYRNKMQES